MVSAGRQQSLLVFTGLLVSSDLYTDLGQSPVVSTGLVSSRLHWSPVVSACLRWSLLVSAGLQWSLLLIYTHSIRWLGSGYSSALGVSASFAI